MATRNSRHPLPQPPQGVSSRRGEPVVVGPEAPNPQRREATRDEAIGGAYLSSGERLEGHAHGVLLGAVIHHGEDRSLLRRQAHGGSYGGAAHAVTVAVVEDR